MDRVLRAILRRAAVLHPQGLCDHLARRNLSSQLARGRDRPSVDAGPLGRGPAPVDQPAASVAQIDLRLGCVCRLAARPRSDTPRARGKLFGRLRRRTPPTVSDGGQLRVVFPTLRWAKETGLELITTQGGSRYATSVGGTLTGRGADLIIVDDPLNANEVHSEPARKRVIDWYGGALVSRLNNKQTGSIVAV